MESPGPGVYQCTCDKDVSAYTGCGTIFNTMNDAVLNALKNKDVRTPENDQLAINAAAQAAESVKDQAETDFTVHVVFKEGNVMGAPEKEAVILKSFNFKPVN